MSLVLMQLTAARKIACRTSLWIVVVATLFCGTIKNAVAAQVLVDFGATSTPTATDSLARTWNNVNAGNDLSGSPFTLLNTASSDSGYRLSVSNPSGVTNPIGFNGENGNGTTAPTGAAAARGYPASATRDSIFGNITPFGSPTSVVEAVRLTLTNLNPNETYSLAFFASRTSAGGDNREAEYFITGGNGSTSLFLNASENTGNVVELTGITPNGSNQIVIDIDRGPNNNNGSGFFYLGVLEINSVAAIPEPSTIGIACTMLGGFACILHRRRRPANNI